MRSSSSWQSLAWLWQREPPRLSHHPDQSQMLAHLAEGSHLGRQTIHTHQGYQQAERTGRGKEGGGGGGGVFTYMHMDKGAAEAKCLC